MSSQQITVAYRILIERGIRDELALKLASRYLKPDTEGEFGFDPSDNQGFQFSLVNSNLYLDYILYDATNEGFLNLDITETQSEEMCAKMESLFPDEFLERISNGVVAIKVLSFHNGGCAGLTEVE